MCAVRGDGVDRVLEWRGATVAGYAVRDWGSGVPRGGSIEVVACCHAVRCGRPSWGRARWVRSACGHWHRWRHVLGGEGSDAELKVI